MNSSESPFNNGVSYSVSATLSRSCMISTVSLPLIALILNKDLLHPTFIPSQFPNPSLIPSDSLILWMPISSGTNYHHFFNHRSLFNLLSAGWCWINLSLIPIIGLPAQSTILITLLTYVLPFLPVTFLLFTASLSWCWNYIWGALSCALPLMLPFAYGTCPKLINMASRAPTFDLSVSNIFSFRQGLYITRFSWK